MWLFLTGSGTITESTLHTLADDVYGAYTDAFSPHLSVASTTDLVELLLYAADEDLSANSTPDSVVGGVSGLMLPANVSLGISWPIAAHYRGGHPRTYLCGIPASAMLNSRQWDPDVRAAFASAAGAFHTALEALTPGGGITTVEHGIISFVNAGAWRTPPVFRRIRDGAVVDSRIDTQRRRLGPDVPS